MPRKKADETDVEQVADDLIAGLDDALNNIKDLDLANADKDIPCIPTGIDLLDEVMGGGIPVGRLCAMTGSAGSGKAQPLDSLVMTPYGWRMIGDLRIGDKVSTPDGSVANVVGIYPQGKQEVYTLEFSDGTSCNCTDEHLWKVRLRGKKNWRVITLRHMLDVGVISNNGASKWVFPYLDKVEFEEKKYVIDPYVLGVLIADGSMCRNVVAFSNAVYDFEIKDKVNNLLLEGYELHTRKTGENCEQSLIALKQAGGKCRNSYMTYLRSIGLNVKSREKFIPEEYLFGSIEQRIDLLRGLMDCDGYIDPKSRYKYSTYSSRLAEDVCKLVRSLGGYAKISMQTRVDRGRNDIEYNVIMKTGDICPFSLKRKVDRWIPGFNLCKKRLDKVTKLESKKDCVCIKLDSADELYITNDYIVTHNTTAAIQYIIGFQKADLKALGIYIDVEQAISMKRLIDLGCDPKRTKLISKTVTMEDINSIISGIMEYKITHKMKEVPYLVIWDSESVTPTKKSLEAPESSKVMGEHSRTLGFILNKLIPLMAKTNVTLVVIQQLRDKISQNPYEVRFDLNYGSNQKATGGSVMQYYPFNLCRTRNKGDLDYDMMGIRGFKTEMTFIKNKNFAPKVPIQVVLDYETGYSDFWTKENLIRERKGFTTGPKTSLVNYKDFKISRRDIKKYYDTDETFREKFEELYNQYKKEIQTNNPWDKNLQIKQPKEVESDLSDEDQDLLSSIKSSGSSEVTEDLNLDNL